MDNRNYIPSSPKRLFRNIKNRDAFCYDLRL